MKPVWTLDQVTDNLSRWNAAWSLSEPINYSFYTSAPAHHGAVQGFSAFSTAQRAALVRVFDLIEDVTALRFNQVPSNGQVPGAGNERIGFLNVNSPNYGFTGATRVDFTDPPGDTRGVISGSDIEINLHRANQRGGWSIGDSNFQTLTHEVLHALGLLHPGEYNGDSGHAQDYETLAQYMQDSTQYTVMSYWGADATGADYFSGGKMRFAATPLLHDIAALQLLYGANHETRSGNTIYGFNSNAGSASYDLGRDPHLIFAIWDGGGRDSLDLSGYATSSRIDLRQGAFSSSGEMKHNIAIAFGAVIENAAGGGGADILIGNAADNRLDGRGGGDTMRGGAGSDLYRVDHVADQVIETPGGGTDTVRAAIDFVLGANVDHLILTGTAAVYGTGNGSANELLGNDSGNIFRGLGGADLLDGGGGNDRLSGGIGADRLRGGDGADAFVFDTARGGEYDSLPDFAPEDDVIRLDRAIFDELSRAGRITNAEFALGRSAADASDRIIYDAASGKIFYDADGLGGAAARLFAVVRPGTELTPADFQGYG